jgi:hypothetical protein
MSGNRQTFSILALTVLAGTGHAIHEQAGGEATGMVDARHTLSADAPGLQGLVSTGGFRCSWCLQQQSSASEAELR